VEPLGARVAQFYALEKNVPVSGTWGGGEASVWAEQMQVESKDVEVVLRYNKSNGWLDGQPAVVTRTLGKGRITYVGAILDENLMAKAAEWMIHDSGVTPEFGPLPEGVEVSRRSGGGNDVYVLINFARDEREVTLPHAMKLLLSGQRASRVKLPTYGVEVALDAR
jgi:beta-galactosidase